MSKKNGHIPTLPGEISEFSLDYHEEIPEDERPTFIVGAPSYRDRLKIKRFSNEYRRIRSRIGIAIGIHPDQVRKDLEDQGVDSPTGEQIRARIMEVLEEFDYEADKNQDLQDLENELQNITIEPGFIEAMLGVNGKPGCLQGWRNLKWGDGSAVEFDKANFLDTLAAWDMDAMIAVAMHIYESSEISGAAVKN